MKTIRVNENEYLIDEKVDITAEKQLCISEIQKINDAFGVVSPSVIWIPTKRYIVISCIAMVLAGAPAFIIAALNRNTELVYFFFLGLIGIPFIPFIIFSCKYEIKKQNRFIQTAKIYPAQIINCREWKERNAGWEYGCWRVHWEIEYCVFLNNTNVNKKLKFSSAIGFHAEYKNQLFDYYKDKRYMMVLFDVKKEKAYAVRLFKKENVSTEK